MKKTALTLTLILAFLFSIVAGLFFAEVGKADQAVLYFKPQYCNLFMESPDVWIELNPESFRVIFGIHTSYELGVDACCYFLDGQNKETRVEDFQLVNERIIFDDVVPDINTTYVPYEEYIFAGQIFLVDLSIGEHKLSVQVQNSEVDTVAYETITFAIPEKPELPEIELIPETFVVASIVTAHVGAIVLVLLVYLIKRKQLRIR